MNKLAALETFHAIADHGTLTGAARRLGKSVPTVVRTLANLEAELGVRLFNRTTRQIDLTDEGADYLAATRQILADLRDAEARVTGNAHRITGQVVVTAPVFFGERHVAAVLPDLQKELPHLSIKLLLADRVTDLIEDHVDLAVRIGHLPSSDLVRTGIGEVRQVLCATPACLERWGAPEDPAALSGHPCIIVEGNSSGTVWPFRGRQGQSLRVEISGPATVNTQHAARRLCLGDAGFGLFLSYQVAGDLRRGRLVRVLADFEPEPQPVQIVHAAGRLPPLRLRAVRDALAARLGPVLSRIALPAP